MYPLVHPALAHETQLEIAARAAALHPVPLAIRPACAADAAALRRLAELDTSPLAARELPTRAADGKVLIAEADGKPVAALALDDGLLVGDPFAPTAGVAALLRMAASQIARARVTPPPLLSRLTAAMHLH